MVGTRSELNSGVSAKTTVSKHECTRLPSLSLFSLHRRMFQSQTLLPEQESHTHFTSFPMWRPAVCIGNVSLWSREPRDELLGQKFRITDTKTNGQSSEQETGGATALYRFFFVKCATVHLNGLLQIFSILFLTTCGEKPSKMALFFINSVLPTVSAGS